MTKTISRFEIQEYLDTTPSGSTRTWSQINKGVSSLSTNWGPKIETEHYIGDKTASKRFDALEPEIPFDINDSDDAVAVFIHGLIWAEKVGSDTETTYMSVITSAAPVSGAYPAKTRKVQVSYSKSGGDAGKPYPHSVALLSMSDAVLGTFNPTTKAFVPTP